MSEFLPPEQGVTESSQSKRMLAWLRGTQGGFGPPDRWSTRVVLLILVVDILFGNLGGAFLDQYVRNWVGWGHAVEKSPHEFTSLSKEDYGDLPQRWKQVLAEALADNSDHMPVAVDLLSWIGTEEISAIGKIASLVLNNRAVYAESVPEISELSGVGVSEISRLRKIGFIDEGPGSTLDVWRDDGRGGIIAGNNVALLCWKEAGGFSLRRMTLTPVGAYIVMLLDPVTDTTYLQRVADRIDKQGAEVEWVYGDVDFDGSGAVSLYPKWKAPWKQFEPMDAEDKT